MEQIHLKAKTREVGKQISKQYRREGMVPGIFYTKGQNSIPINSLPVDLRPIVYTKDTKIVNLVIEGESEPRECVLKDVVFHPVTDKISHFDLLGIIPGQKITVDVPVRLKGQSIGVRLGGILQQVVHRLNVHCLPKDLPSQIEIDIANMNMGDHVSLKSLQLEGVEFMIPLDTTVVQVVAPRGADKVAETPAATPAKGKK